MMEEQYMEMMKEMNLDMTEAWKSAVDLEEELVHGNAADGYTYAKDNPYT
jgi:hypothetical protein